jgi:hypothetical protein
LIYQAGQKTLLWNKLYKEILSKIKLYPSVYVSVLSLADRRGTHGNCFFLGRYHSKQQRFLIIIMSRVMTRQVYPLLLYVGYCNILLLLFFDWGFPNKTLISARSNKNLFFFLWFRCLSLFKVFFLMNRE